MRPCTPAVTLLIGALSLLCPAPAAAQRTTATGSVGVYAEVLAPPLTAVGTRSLQFGAVPIPGDSVTVLPGSASAGEWRLSGVKNRRFVDIGFTLPDSLRNQSGAGIAVDWNGMYAQMCEIIGTSCDPAYPRDEWNPSTTIWPTTIRFRPDRRAPGRKVFPYDEMSVFIGGKLKSRPNQPPGTYRGTITIYVVAT